MSRPSSVPTLGLPSEPEVAPLRWDDLDPALAESLRPKVDRLGYLGAFFVFAGRQPAATELFHRFTESLRAVLPGNLAEVVALTCSTLTSNDYEFAQHSRLAASIGLTPEWIEAVCTGAVHRLSEDEAAVYELAHAAVAGRVRGELAAAATIIGAGRAIAVLLLTGRFVAHACVSAALGLRDPFLDATPDDRMMG